MARGGLFGRPDALLVDEEPPRIELPSAPALPLAPAPVPPSAARPLLPDPVDDEELDDEGGAPLRVFMGAPGRAAPVREPDVFDLSAIVAEERAEARARVETPVDVPAAQPFPSVTFRLDGAVARPRGAAAPPPPPNDLPDIGAVLAARGDPSRGDPSRGGSPPAGPPSDAPGSDVRDALRGAVPTLPPGALRPSDMQSLGDVFGGAPPRRAQALPTPAPRRAPYARPEGAPRMRTDLPVRPGAQDAPRPRPPWAPPPAPFDNAPTERPVRNLARSQPPAAPVSAAPPAAAAVAPGGAAAPGEPGWKDRLLASLEDAPAVPAPAAPPRADGRTGLAGRLGAAGRPLDGPIERPVREPPRPRPEARPAPASAESAALQLRVVAAQPPSLAARALVLILVVFVGAAGGAAAAIQAMVPGGLSAVLAGHGGASPGVIGTPTAPSEPGAVPGDDGGEADPSDAVGSPTSDAPAAPVDPVVVVPPPAAPPPAVVPRVAGATTDADRLRKLEDAGVSRGLLRVRVDRPATVYADGKRIGFTKYSDAFELSAGTHRVRVVSTSGQRREMDARVDGGLVREVEFRFGR